MATVYSGYIVFEPTSSYVVYYTTLTSYRAGTRWTISDTGLLTITAVGDQDLMAYGAFSTYTYKDALTDAQKKAVKTISIGSHVWCASSSMYYNFFPNLTSLTAYSFPITGVARDCSYFVSGCTKLTSVAFKPDTKTSDCSYMFNGCTALKTVDLTNLDTSSAESAMRMFYNCSSLTTVTFGSSCTLTSADSLYRMFYNCTKLKTINGWSYIRTSSLTTNMAQMFYNCESLTSISFANINTAYVTDAKYMFSGCTSLTSITLGTSSTFVSNKYFQYMFGNCSKLTTINGLNNMRTNAALDMSYMFYECSALTTAIPFTNANTSSVTNARSMFYNCAKIPSVSLGTYSTFSNCTDMSYMFYGCSSMTAINGLPNLYTPACTSTTGMFYNCKNLGSIVLSGLSTGNVTNMKYMFCNCESATTINVSGFNTSKVTDMSWMFKGCSSVTSLDLSSFSSEALTTTYYMFYDDVALATITFGSSFNCASVTDMGYMFYYCTNLTTVDVSEFTPINAWNLAGMFADCRSLSDTGISSGFVTTSATRMQNMFLRCHELEYVNLSGFNTSAVTDMHSMFGECRELAGIEVAGFVTTNVTDMSYMFYGAKKITTLRVGDFNTGRVSNFSYMFEDTAVSQLDLSNFTTLAATSMKRMFYNCKNLTSLDLSTFNTTNVTDMANMFYGTVRLETVTIGANFSTDALADSAAKVLSFAPATNTTTSEAVIDDIDFVQLTTVAKQGVWNRAVVNAFDSTAYRSADGYAEPTGEDVTFHVRWVTSAITADRTLTIYKKLASAPTYPAEPEMVVELEGSAGEQDVVLENAGSDAYDFRLEFYDGTDTFYSFPAVDSTMQLVVITQEGNVKLYFDDDATSGVDYDIFQYLTLLGWEGEVLT